MFCDIKVVIKNILSFHFLLSVHRNDKLVCTLAGKLHLTDISQRTFLLGLYVFFKTMLYGKFTALCANRCMLLFIES